MSEVYVNGKYVGSVADGKAFMQQMVDERRKNTVSSRVNVHYNTKIDSVFVETSKGRLRRPLIVVKDGKSMLTDKVVQQLERKDLTWQDLVKQGIIEYLDAAEEENALVALTPHQLTKEHTHVEVSPLDMLGLAGSLVPFGNYTPLTRLTFGAKNQKQAVGFYAANFSLRFDTDVNLYVYPETPIVQTIMHDIYQDDKHPAGQNLTVAVLSYKGYNMEDALVMNKASIDRGMGRSFYFNPYVATELRYSGGLMDTICVPDKDVKGYKLEKDYRFLEDDGIVSVEAKVHEGDMLIGRVSPPRFLSGMDEYNLAQNINRDSSVSLKATEQAVIDFVAVTENEEGNKMVQVRLREQRIPEIGDKFTSRYGQKGIIGLIVPQSDMPFTSHGVVPDVCFSPNGIPSRMTVSHLLELISGKVGALSGRFIDGTTFATETERDIRDELKEMGFNETGKEVMYSGITGEKLQARIYVGNMYYMRLKHMVAKRLQSRAMGPVQLLTRQPTEGRAKEGGLRLGEMEKDTFVAHGASMLLKERFDSDKTVVPVSEASGMLAIDDLYRKRVYDPIVGDDVEVSYIEMSYAFKLFLDEMKAMGIYPKLTLKEKY
ncbi:MAG: DNA-directed RNA polymerase subunit B [Candidatus Woesearchaeota archaeon]